MTKKWEYYKIDKEKVARIAKEFNISELLARVIINRGISEEEIPVFLNPTRNDFLNPYLMPDMEKAVQRILKAIENQENVLIYGDYDVDGITSITVLKSFLQERGLDTGYYVPNRLDEGYGLNKTAIEEIKKMGYTLMITVDCGISSIEEIDFANSLGIETIITDHHEPIEKLPNALAVVNAKREDSCYPFRELAGVGTVFKLIQAISKKLYLDEKQFLKYLDLVCLGTISDIVPLVSENRTITKLGLKLIEETKNVGLRELILSTELKKINVYAISFGLAPKINASGRLGHEKEALELLLTNDINKAKGIANRLNQYNEKRQLIEKTILEEAEEEIKKKNMKNMNSIILAKDSWHHGVIGIVCSKITEKFARPSILICFEGDIGKGSGRSIPNFDLHQALQEMSKYLEQYGGHSMAVGLTIKKENFESFKDAFEKYAESKNVKKYIPTLKIDAEITKEDIDKKLLKEIAYLEPYGEKNKEPVFIYKNLKINSIRALLDGQHLKLNLKDGNTYIDAIGFNLGELSQEYLIGDKVDVVGTVDKNIYKGEETIQIKIHDMMKSLKKG